MMYAEKNWPFYSGGGVGTLRGVRGDFAAEVDYTVDTVAQATTLEMAGPDRHAAALGSDAACATSRPRSSASLRACRRTGRACWAAPVP